MTMMIETIADIRKLYELTSDQDPTTPVDLLFGEVLCFTDKNGVSRYIQFDRQRGWTRKDDEDDRLPQG
jgi:hypothetical protein